MKEWSVKIYVLDQAGNEHPATCFTKVTYNLHPSFEDKTHQSKRSRSPRGRESSARSRSRTRDIGPCTVPRTARRAREKHGAGNGSVPLLLLLCPPLLRPAQLLLALLERPEVDEQALCRRVGDLPVFVRAGEHVVGVGGEVAVAS